MNYKIEDKITEVLRGSEFSKVLTDEDIYELAKISVKNLVGSSNHRVRDQMEGLISEFVQEESRKFIKLYVEKHKDHLSNMICNWISHAMDKIVVNIMEKHLEKQISKFDSELSRSIARSVSVGLGGHR